MSVPDDVVKRAHEALDALLASATQTVSGTRVALDALAGQEKKPLSVEVVAGGIWFHGGGGFGPMGTPLSTKIPKGNYDLVVMIYPSSAPRDLYPQAHA